MDTNNKRRDKKMREMFEEEKFPTISGNAGSAVLSEIRAGKAKVPLKLKIRDIEKPVTATVSHVVVTDSRIKGELAFDVSLADYRLDPPRPLGMIKVDDKVSVTVTVILDAK